MKSLICTGGIALAFALTSVTGAEAQKKMTYQEAFAKCKQEIGASAPGNESLSTAARHSAGTLPLSSSFQSFGRRAYGK